MSLHDCPVDGCRVTTVPSYQLMCPRHWRMVPRDQQRELYGSWNRGLGAGTERHRAAMAACINAVEAEEAKP